MKSWKRFKEEKKEPLSDNLIEELNKEGIDPYLYKIYLDIFYNGDETKGSSIEYESCYEGEFNSLAEFVEDYYTYDAYDDDMSIEFDTFFLVCVNLSDIGEVLINEYIEEDEDYLQKASLFIGDDEDTEDSDTYNTQEEESIIKEELNTFFNEKRRTDGWEYSGSEYSDIAEEYINILSSLRGITKREAVQVFQDNHPNEKYIDYSSGADFLFDPYAGEYFYYHDPDSSLYFIFRSP